MWRQMFRVLPKNFSNIYCKATTVQKISNRKRILLHSAFLMSVAHAMLDLPENASLPDELSSEQDDTPITAIDDLQLAAEIESTYAESGEALKDLIKTLHACIQEICEQYQHAIAKQIEIMMACMQLDPVGAHWDEVTKYRVIADDLKAEFVKYKTLVSTIGSIVKNDHFKRSESVISKGEATQIAEAYKELIQMIDKKSKENVQWDSKLTDVHMKSILVTDVK